MRKSVIPQTPVKQKKSNYSQAVKTFDRRTPSSESPQGKRRPIKVDLKLEYMQNEINQINRFKELLQDINLSTKELIKQNNDEKSLKQNDNQEQKRRNSFSLNENMFKKHFNQLEDLQKQDKAGLLTKQSEAELKPQPKKLYLNKLSVISKLMTQKNTEINEQILHLKKKMMYSSMWQDKQFFDFTQFNYSIKMNQIQERLEISEKNLQQKQNQKKTNPEKALNNQNCGIVRFGLYESDTKEGLALGEYFDVKSKILTELKQINEIYVKFEELKSTNESIKFQLQQTQKDNSNSSQRSSQIEKTHQLLRSAHFLKSQVQRFAQIIQAYRAQQSKKKKQQQNEPQNITNLLYHKIRLLNKEILQRQLSITKQKISKLKHETEIIENGIKELEASKALTLLRNKHEEQKRQAGKKENSKSLKSTNRNDFDDEILKIILENQFLTKKLALRIETKFTGIEKRNIRSISDTNAKRQVNHFRIVKFVKKYFSMKKINRGQNLETWQIKQKKQQSQKLQKRTGLQIISTLGSKKEIGSSASTNP